MPGVDSGIAGTDGKPFGGAGGGKLLIGDLDPSLLDADLPRRVAKKLAESRSTLGGLEVKVLEEGAAVPLIKAPTLDKEAAKILDKVGVSMPDMARLAVLESEGHPVPGSMKKGLFMPNKANEPVRFAERVAELEATSTEALVMTAKLTSGSYSYLRRKEAMLRFDNWLQHDSAARDQAERVPAGLTKDKHRANMFESFLKEDFSVQKMRGKDPKTGQVPVLPEKDFNLFGPLRRGFAQLESMLRGRGVTLDFGVDGSRTKRAARARDSANWTKEANAGSRRRDSGGYEM